MIPQLNQYDSESRRHGVWEHHYKNGPLWQRAHYLHGTLHGLCEEYYKDGTLESRYHYLHGKLHGLLEYCRFDGIPQFKSYFFKIR